MDQPSAVIAAASAPRDRRKLATSTVSSGVRFKPPSSQSVGAKTQRSGVQPFEFVALTSRFTSTDSRRKHMMLRLAPAAA